METTKINENKKIDFDQGDKYSYETICMLLKEINPEIAIEVYFLEKKKLNNPSEQLGYLTDVVHTESLFWDPDRKVMTKYIPFVRYFVDDRFDRYQFKNCDLFYESDGSKGNILMESVSRGKDVSFTTSSFKWGEVRWVTLVPFELDNVPSSYVLVRFKNIWADGQKIRDYLFTIVKKLEGLGARPKYGLLDGTLRARRDSVHSTYFKYKAISVLLAIAGLVLLCLVIGAIG